MNKYLIIGLVVLLILLGVQQYLIWNNSTVSTDEKILKQINKIESKIDSISTKRDSIKTVILTVEKEIIKNNEKHEKVVYNIINSNDSLNYIWAKQYIDQYRRKHSK